MIATGVAAPFLTPFKLSLVASIFIAIPYIFYQFWSFVAPGLYNHEKRLAMPLIASSVILFYSGILFSFYIVFPLMFAFFTATTPEGVAMMTDISQYLDFILKMFFAFGVAFEVPVFTIVLTITGVTNADKLAQKRPYVIVGSFVIGMLLTPPDIVSQTLLAIPVWLLFELGIVFSRIIGKRKAREEAENNDAPDKKSRNSTSSKDSNDTSEPDEARYKAMTDAEMEAELDAIEREEGS
jgi:sec-independent protein translocase protein TatC